MKLNSVAMYLEYSNAMYLEYSKIIVFNREVNEVYV